MLKIVVDFVVQAGACALKPRGRNKITRLDFLSLWWPQLVVGEGISFSPFPCSFRRVSCGMTDPVKLGVSGLLGFSC